MAQRKSTPQPAPSEPYLGLARKWRPQTFGELVGQEDVARSLQNALSSGRLVHGHLLAGPRGVGKTTSARILARALNCVEGPTPEPCGKCRHCIDIAAGSDMDVMEIDAASNTQVEKMRELLENVVLSPFGSRYKVYVIDEVHMLSLSSFNALLKTLEEPPEHVVFIFATTELEKIPETVRSRCAVHNFRRLSTDDIVRRLGEVARGEGVDADADASREVFGLIAQSVEGGMRDALVALDQLIAMDGGKLDVEAAQRMLGLSSREALAQTVSCLADGDAKSLIALVDDLVNRGRSLERFVKGLVAYLHDVMLLQADPETEYVALTGQALARAKEQAGAISQAAVFNMINQLLELEERMKRSSQGRFLVEFTFLRMAAIKPLVPLDDVIKRLKALPSTASAAPADPNPTPRPASAASPGPGEASERKTGYRSALTSPSSIAPPSRASAMSGARPAATMREPDAAPAHSPAGAKTESSTGFSLEGHSRDELLNLFLPMLPDGGRLLGGYLENAVSMRADADALHILWARNDRVGPKIIASAQVRRELEQTLTQICGRPMTVQSSVSAEVEAPAEPRAEPQPIAASVAVMNDYVAEEPAESFEEFPPPPVDYNPETLDAEEVAFLNRHEREKTGRRGGLGVDITESTSREALASGDEFARRARMVKDFFSGTFVDGAGRSISV